MTDTIHVIYFSGMTRPEIWTKDKCKQVLREFHAYALMNYIPLTIAEYNKWRKGKDLPHVTTIENALGAWTSAKSKSISASYCHGARWSQEDCDRIIKAFQIHCHVSRVNPTQRQYSIWQKTQDRTPSFNTLLTRKNISKITMSEFKLGL